MRGSCSAMGFSCSACVRKRSLFHSLALPQGAPLATWCLASSGPQVTSAPGLVSVLGSRVQLGFRAGTFGHPVLLPELISSAVSVARSSADGGRVLAIGAGFLVQGVVVLARRACRSRWILLLPFPEWPRGKQACHSFTVA